MTCSASYPSYSRQGPYVDCCLVRIDPRTDQGAGLMGRCIPRSPALMASRRSCLALPTAGHSVLRHVEVLYLLCSPSYPGRASRFGRVTGILHNTGHHYSITGLPEAHVWLGGVILCPWPIFFWSLCSCCVALLEDMGIFGRGFRRWEMASRSYVFLCLPCSVGLFKPMAWLFSILSLFTPKVLFLAGVERNI